MGNVGTYQGEVTNKGTIQRAFKQQLRAAKADPAADASQDWSARPPSSTPWSTP